MAFSIPSRVLTAFFAPAITGLDVIVVAEEQEKYREGFERLLRDLKADGNPLPTG